MSRIKKERLEQLQTLLKDVMDEWPYRKGKEAFIEHLERQIRGDKEPITRSLAMMAACYMCSGGWENGPADCQSYSCPLYGYQPYKHGKARKEYTEEERIKLMERVAKMHAAKKQKGV